MTDKSQPNPHLALCMERQMRLKGFTRTVLARKAGMPIQSISKIMTGQRSPTLETLTKIATALDCSVSDLLLDEDIKTQRNQNQSVTSLIADAVKQFKKSQPFSSLTLCTPETLIDLVERFGGWNFLYQYLLEDIELRVAAEKEYQKMRTELLSDETDEAAHERKKKMIIANLIARATKGDHR